MDSSLRGGLALGMCALVLLGGCVGPGYYAEEQRCSAIWFERLPVRKTQEVREREKAIEVPDGTQTCETVRVDSKRLRTTCKQNMKTEWITETYIATVDQNEYRRDQEIRVCTEIACTLKYGDRLCRIQ